MISYAAWVKGADGRPRVLWRHLLAEAPHLVREDRLWIARAPGHTRGLGFDPCHAIRDLVPHPAVQEARGNLMAHLGRFPQEPSHVSTP